MQPVALDFSRIQQDTGADKVIMTASHDSVLECDLYFIKEHRGVAVQAEFDIADDEQFEEACEWVRLEVETRLYSSQQA